MVAVMSWDRLVRDRYMILVLIHGCEVGISWLYLYSVSRKMFGMLIGMLMQSVES